MAVAGRTKTKGVKGTRRKKKPKVEIDMSEYVKFIPEGEVMEAPDNFLDYVVLIYGEMGAGKTSTLAQAPGSYVIQCDRNRLGLSIRQSNIPNDSLETIRKTRTRPTPWELVVATVEACLNDNSVKTIVIDNFKKMYTHASNHYCKKNNVDTLSEMDDYGVSWNLVDAMYLDLFEKIVDSGRGIALITHDSIGDLELPSGKVQTRIQPDLSGRPFKAMESITNFVFYICKNAKGEREMIIRQRSNDIMTKCSTDEKNPRFLSPEGKPVSRISMGSSPQQGWKNLIASWNNEMPCVVPTKTFAKKKGTKKKKVTKKKVSK